MRKRDFLLINIKKPRRWAWAMILILSLLGFDGVDGDLLVAPADPFEFNDAGDSGEEGIIPTLLDVVARVDLGATLAIEDRAGGDDFAVAGFGT